MSIAGASAVLASGASLAERRACDDSNGDARSPADLELARRARAQLAELEVDYHRALDRGMRAESREAIDLAFDEADRLQRQLVVAIRRLRAVDKRPRSAAARQRSEP